MAQHTRLALYGCIYLLALLVTGCAINDSSFQDVSPDTQSQQLPTPKGNYDEAIWLNRNEMVFRIAPTVNKADRDKARPPSQWDYQIAIYTLDNNGWHIASVSKPSDCFSGWVSELERLPNETLGYIYWCNTLSGCSGLKILDRL